MLLEAAEIPVPNGTVIRTEEGLQEAVEKYGYPLVIKPIDGNHGKGNTTNITTWEQALTAFEAAKLYGRSLIIEKFITGVDFRVLVINYKFICAALRTPASVTGDGSSSIQQLIDLVNSDPRRGYGHEKVLTQITVDQFTQKMLDEAGYTHKFCTACRRTGDVKTNGQPIYWWHFRRCNRRSAPRQYFYVRTNSTYYWSGYLRNRYYGQRLAYTRNRKRRCYPGSKCGTGFQDAY